MTQVTVKQILKQQTGGSVICLTSAMVEHPISGVYASLATLTKSGLKAVTRSLATEYAKDGIRFNAVARGVVDTPLHKDTSKDVLKALSPMGEITDIVDAVDVIVF